MQYCIMLYIIAVCSIELHHLVLNVLDKDCTKQRYIMLHYDFMPHKIDMKLYLVAVY